MRMVVSPGNGAQDCAPVTGETQVRYSEPPTNRSRLDSEPYHGRVSTGLTHRVYPPVFAPKMPCRESRRGSPAGRFSLPCNPSETDTVPADEWCINHEGRYLSLGNRGFSGAIPVALKRHLERRCYLFLNPKSGVRVYPGSPFPLATSRPSATSLQDDACASSPRGIQLRMPLGVMPERRRNAR